jgi:hypothetical protein
MRDWIDIDGNGCPERGKTTTQCRISLANTIMRRRCGRWRLGLGDQGRNLLCQKGGGSQLRYTYLTVEYGKKVKKCPHKIIHEIPTLSSLPAPPKLNLGHQRFVVPLLLLSIETLIWLISHGQGCLDHRPAANSSYITGVLIQGWQWSVGEGQIVDQYAGCMRRKGKHSPEHLVRRMENG